MANPQPDIFLKWSKELWKAKIKIRIPGVANQVFDAIAYLTYGQNPPIKEAKIEQKAIAELTGLHKMAVSKAMTQLLKMNLVTKNGYSIPPTIGINKDYETWKPVTKKGYCLQNQGSIKTKKKRVTKNGYYQSPKMVTRKISTLYKLENREKVDELYELYKTEIQPLRKSSARAKENISYYLKKYTYTDLSKAILNYKTTIEKTGPEFRKDPANFFGKNDRYFIDYLPDNFKSITTKPRQTRTVDSLNQELDEK